jgi:DNA polymerase III subunit epsilon
MKFFFCDLETTGLDHKKHGVWQIGYQVRIDGIQVDRGTLECQPLKGKLVSPEALEKCGKTIEQLRALPAPHTVFRQLKDTLSKFVEKYDKKDKFFFVGYNAQFDSQFLRQWFEDLGDQYFGSWFWYPFIDVVQLAGFCLMRQRTRLENFKLGTVSSHLGFDFDEEQAHDAQYDIDLTRMIFDKLVADGLVVLEEIA